MDTAQALLKAICENPDDDLPRLVYADWLDENGQPERARFIRLQIAISYRAVSDQNPLKIESEALLKKNRKEWNESINALQKIRGNGVVWIRGFPSRITLTSSCLLQCDPRMFQEFPIQSMHICNMSGPLSRDLFRRVSSFQRLRELCIGPNYRGFVLRNNVPVSNFIRGMLRRPLFQELQILNFMMNPIDNNWLIWFVSEVPASSFADTLRELNLSHCHRITDAGANVLATARSLSKLTTLNLKGVPLSAASIAMLRNRFGDGLIV